MRETPAQVVNLTSFFTTQLTGVQAKWRIADSWRDVERCVSTSRFIQPHVITARVNIIDIFAIGYRLKPWTDEAQTTVKNPSTCS